MVWLALAFVGLFAGAEIWYAFLILSGVNSTATIVVSELKGGGNDPGRARGVWGLDD